MRKVVSFVSGLMTGGVVGLALGLLLAPASGEDFRKDVEARVGRLQREMKRAASTRRQELEAQLAALRSASSSEEKEA